VRCEGDVSFGFGEIGGPAEVSVEDHVCRVVTRLLRERRARLSLHIEGSCSECEQRRRYISSPPVGLENLIGCAPRLYLVAELAIDPRHGDEHWQDRLRVTGRSGVLKRMHELRLHLAVVAPRVEDPGPQHARQVFVVPRRS
jgi:hypothetical protein